jgi:uncharacterized alpha-E superfamily protein
MLSRTADNLFWMARYTERAENTARMLDVTCQAALLMQAGGEDAWGAALRISELDHAFRESYPAITRDHVLEFMVRDPANASSIFSCLRAARENARAVRGTLTTEMWETENTTWLEFRQRLTRDDWKVDPSTLFERVKIRSHLSRGVTIGTMLRDESLHFLRLGTFLERADNTARILDVKFHEVSETRRAESESSTAETYRDYYHWTALLRSVSALEIFRKVYREAITPARVAELLILRDDMPRSLRHCLENVVNNLASVCNSNSAETQRRAGLLHAELRYGRIDDILEQGLHAYLIRFLESINDVGSRVSQDFLVAVADTPGMQQTQSIGAVRFAGDAS